MQQDKEKVSLSWLAEFSPSRPPFYPSVASAILCVPPLLSFPYLSSSSSSICPLPLPLLFALFIRRPSCLQFAFPYLARNADPPLSYLR
jgi:hypothetical protein